MKTSTVLKRSLDVLNENGWTQGGYARNKWRHQVLPTSPSAVKFCAYGAVCRVTGYDGKNLFLEPPMFSSATRFLTDAVRDVTGNHWMSLDDFNDDPQTKREDVVRVFKRAIRLAKDQRA